MKFSLAIAAAAAALSSSVRAAQSFAGSNLYYAAGLTDDESTTLLTGLQSAGVKVLRVWLDGESGTVKGTPINDYPSLESGQPGNWNDTVLSRLDDFMDKAHGYGIKLLVSMHSYNALSATPPDIYGAWYGTGDFYTSSDAMGYFKNRIAHIMNHVNPHNNKRWADSPEYIFAFEAENEAMHDQQNPSALTAWQCTMATAIRSNFQNGTSNILITTGGGAYLANSLLDAYFSCADLDVLAIHAYGTGDFATSALTPYVQKAQSSNKKLIMEEWGACYYSSENQRCDQSSALDSGTRDENIKTWADQISKAGIPWFYWQILPNEDPHSDWDYEVGINGVNWDALEAVANATAGYEAAFDFSAYLL
ncbi:glycoside hydrolase superfamily [Talaromyces proteolyticus]|uniref:mannan endo-1,4-beta-mannosidase n=1 Tax=Talaromyces proteolyticus TaxID=1131652 RepID=A0AAD4KCT0_9EURO|nr:glycoside hydrolase superfamily [Talaromyces proteolyticus]KAH8688763.1 glycoside hydrolase superfamily [Talaromyces proteolyticus]